VSETCEIEKHGGSVAGFEKASKCSFIYLSE
jgi:hypothetical protein